MHHLVHQNCITPLPNEPELAQKPTSAQKGTSLFVTRVHSGADVRGSQIGGCVLERYKHTEGRKKRSAVLCHRILGDHVRVPEMIGGAVSGGDCHHLDQCWIRSNDRFERRAEGTMGGDFLEGVGHNRIVDGAHPERLPVLIPDDPDPVVVGELGVFGQHVSSKLIRHIVLQHGRVQAPTVFQHVIHRLIDG